MSLPSQVNTDKSGKHRAAAMKEAVQHSGEGYYGLGPSALESSHGDSAGSSAVYNPEKGPQSLPHYQQAAPVKWMHQDSIQAPSWSQEAPVPAWGQNFGPYMSGVNVRGQMAFHKGVHEGLPMGGENQLPAPVEVYRDATQAQAQGRGLEWEQHAAAAMHQAQLQAYQHGHKGVELQGQPHVPPHTLQGSMLQPFQTTFRQGKQQFSSGYYPVFPGNKAMPNLAYGEQPKTQQQLLHQMQQQQMHHHHHQQQQQQQQQLHQQRHLQLQQQQQQQQQQQHLQQQQHQIQQHQMQQQQQQQQMQQMQQQYHQLQERQQQLQQMQQQLQQQNVPQQETSQPQVQPKQPQTQNFAAYQPPEPRPPDTGAKKDVKSLEQEPEAPTCDASAAPDSCPEKVAANPAESTDAAPAAPRRSRRLSRDGQSPLGPPSTNIWSQASKEPPPSQNGVAGVQAVRGGEGQVTTGGVIQITRRRRRASKEINLETLAQKASEMESLPAKKEDGPPGRQAAMVPLVIPVSVPVHRSQTDPQGGWAQGRLGQGDRPADRKPSVIVARRRSLRNSMTESLGQDGENDPGLDEDGKAKFKRRPRPEPLIIPPPKPSTFIPPSVYSSITSYQSNLRSPVRMPDNPLILPPYTPPPILSPVREGSGLYFSTFLTNMATSNQILPPPATPKSATRSLLRSTSSSEITPPVLPLISDVTPVSLEPRINIGQQYQAEIPDLRDQPSSQFDQHKADLVWLPLDNSNLKHGDQESMVDLMNMACSSVLKGGGTNQELALHCLHECGGDFLETLGRLMHQDPLFPKGHHLTGYHYSGSDSWTAEEKRYFNKGISAYRKDFFLVQKLVQTKTVAQCVEFYYTYKKQVKIGRNGILTFGPPYSPGEKHPEAVLDVKCSQQPKVPQGELDGDDQKDVSYDQSHESSQQARVAQSLQAHDYAGTVLVIKEPDSVSKEAYQPSGPQRPRSEPAAKKPRVPTKTPQDPDAIFPCKKCGRVFYKVKSRSAHMKSHAEQEKKAAALRQREEEEQAAAQARARKAAAAAAAAVATYEEGNGNGETEQADLSSQEDSSEGEDDKDEDWH